MSQTAYLIMAVILLPVGASFAVLVCSPTLRRIVQCLAAMATLICAVLAAAATLHTKGVTDIALSGWQVPLGIRLHVDGLSALLLVTTALIGLCLTLFAESYFGDKAFAGRLSYFWPIWFLVWAALNGLFVSGDAFNLYVNLEIINLAAVALVALPRTREAFEAGLRYLVIAFLGSLSYLFGVMLLYSSFGTLDLYLLAETAAMNGPYITAAVFILVGLMIKTAIFPVHFWLPPAHANAPTPVSALLSGLVVTASAYMIIRLAFTVFAPLLLTPLTMLLGILGGLAVLWGSLHAFLQERI